MAYIEKEKVSEIRKEIKKAFPEYKFSIVRQDYSSINVFLMEADFEIKEDEKYINPVYLENIKNENLKNMFIKIKNIIFGIAKYHNNSDIMTDYFDVAYYYNFNVGKWDKPYAQTCQAEAI